MRVHRVFIYIVILSIASTPIGVGAQSISQEIVVLTNNYRDWNDLPPLGIDPLLVEAAQLKAEHMAENDYFAHVAPGGEDPVYWLEQVSYPYSHAGENIAAGTLGYISAEKTVDLWIASTGHRENLLSTDFTHIGVGSADGILEGEETTFYVQMFGTPSGEPPVVQQEEPENEPPVVEEEEAIEETASTEESQLEETVKNEEEDVTTEPEVFEEEETEPEPVTEIAEPVGESVEDEELSSQAFLPDSGEEATELFEDKPVAKHEADYINEDEYSSNNVLEYMIGILALAVIVLSFMLYRQR